MQLQKELDKLAAGNTLKLKAGEYEGPLIINKPCKIEGYNSTIWAACGPVIDIQSPGVTLKNLSIEVTGEQSSASPSVAVAVQDGCKPGIDSVELQGTVLGMDEEAGSWEIPAVIDLGILPVNTRTSRKFLLSVPVVCALETDVNGLDFGNKKLSPGPNTLEIVMEPSLKNTVIWGSLFLVSRYFVRRIRITGMIGHDASVDELGRYTSQVAWHSAEMAPSRNPLEQVAEPGRLMQKGQRISIDELAAPGAPLIAALGWDSEMPFDIDVGVFILDEFERVHGDADLIYYNQPELAGGGLRLLGAGDLDIERVELDLKRIAPEYHRISFCLSIYEFEKNLQTFSSVRGLYIRLIEQATGKELLRYIPDKTFSLETAVVIAQIYRYKGQWRFATVGAGFKDGLGGLCRQYGIETE